MTPSTISLPPLPRIGQTITHDGKLCRIFRIPSYGVIEVEEIDGPGAWRIQGFAWAIVRI